MPPVSLNTSLAQPFRDTITLEAKKFMSWKTLFRMKQVITQQAPTSKTPTGFQQVPFSEVGCIILVKLEQFQAGDHDRVCINTQISPWLSGQGRLTVLSLHDFQGEHTALIHWPAGEVFQPHIHMSSEEIYEVQGEFIDDYGRYPAGTWIRSPHVRRHYF